jgi:hypothetical protein
MNDNFMQDCDKNEYNEYNKKMDKVYNILKFDYLVQVAVNELNKIKENEVKENEIKEKEIKIKENIDAIQH